MFSLQACVLRATQMAAEVPHERRRCAELWLIFRQLHVLSHKDCFFA